MLIGFLLINANHNAIHFYTLILFQNVHLLFILIQKNVFTEIRNLNHPFHVHGYPLHVMQMGQHPDGIPMTRKLVNKMFTEKMLPLKPYDHIPPLKDTVSVPSRGYVVVRFRADNPGTCIVRHELR